MKNSTFRFKLLLYLTVFLLPKVTGAQSYLEQSNMGQDFARAEAYLLSFNNDSANIVLTKIIDELTEVQQLNTPFGLKVQMRQAEAFEKDHKDEIAIEKLLHVVEGGKEKKLWDVLTHAYLSLARLQEKIGRKDPCLNHLRKAESIIQTYNVDSLYTRYAIRISSYHRIFGERDSSLYFANEVIRTAPLYGLDEEGAVGYLLMGLLLSKTSYKEAAKHYIAAGEVWKKGGDYSGYGATQGNLSRLYLRNNQPEKALVYNDSALVAASKAEAMGVDEGWLIYTNYKQRANIYYELGKTDSAWHYINKGYQTELDNVYQSNNDKVIEIEARYNEEKNAKKIVEQALEIQNERDRKYLLSGILSVVFLLSSLLFYSYLHLRRANKKTEEQALAITKANEDLSTSLQRQIILQGEVHHRVKNNLQVIISLLELQMEEIDHPIVNESFTAMSNRIYSMAAIHEILYQQEGSARVGLKDYVENLCGHFSNFSRSEFKPIFNVDLGDFTFNLETSMPLGVIITELLTNSLKYGRIDGQKLIIEMNLEQIDDAYCLRYKDNGPGFPKGTLEEREGGLGTYLMKSMSRQLSGYLESKNDNGALYKIYFKEKKIQY